MDSFTHLSQLKFRLNMPYMNKSAAASVAILGLFPAFGLVLGNFKDHIVDWDVMCLYLLIVVLTSISMKFLWSVLMNQWSISLEEGPVEILVTATTPMPHRHIRASYCTFQLLKPDLRFKPPLITFSLLGFVPSLGAAIITKTNFPLLLGIFFILLCIGSIGIPILEPAGYVDGLKLYHNLVGTQGHRFVVIPSGFGGDKDESSIV